MSTRTQQPYHQNWCDGEWLASQLHKTSPVPANRHFDSKHTGWKTLSVLHPQRKGTAKFFVTLSQKYHRKQTKKTEVDFLRLKRNVIHLNSTQSHLKTFKYIWMCISAYFVLVSKLLTPMTSTPKHSRNMKIIIGLAHCVHFSCIFIFRFDTVPFSKRHFIPVCLLLELPIR